MKLNFNRYSNNLNVFQDEALSSILIVLAENFPKSGQLFTVLSRSAREVTAKRITCAKAEAFS